MDALYPGIEEARALIVDGNHTSRSILAAQLRDLGVGTVVQSSRPQDARGKLEHATFDFVLCDYHFENCEYSGQDLLDDLRRSQLLPYFTTFVMVTGEASYNKVAEAAESALDSYIVKPYTATSLGERLLLARRRKLALAKVFEALEAGDTSRAAALCVQRYIEGLPYGLYAARIGGELFLRQGRFDEAKALYQKLMERNPPPAWARLGLARTLLDSQQAPQAKKILESLVKDAPDFAEGHDLLGKVQVEQGDMNEALETYKHAWDITPSSITRSAKLGAITFYMGEQEEAKRPLERAAALGAGSKMFDNQSLVLLAFVRYDARDPKGVRRSLSQLEHTLHKSPDNARLMRQIEIVKVLAQLADKHTEAAKSEMFTLGRQLDAPDLDVEGACNILSLLARMPSETARGTRAKEWVESLVWRFSGTKAAAQLMTAASESLTEQHDQVLAVLAQAQSAIQTALTYALTGERRHTVVELINLAKKWRNAKWAEMAAHALDRHKDHIPDADALTGSIRELKSMFAGQPSKLPLGNEDGRQTGGLSLRVQKSSAEIAPTPAMA
ncbi:MAG TPA: tetratricopeptide repeat protein [Aquabacterium sp.]|nr:tetratricopeptide repeat protein [Aquabacterium sp.]